MGCLRGCEIVLEGNGKSFALPCHRPHPLTECMGTLQIEIGARRARIRRKHNFCAHGRNGALAAFDMGCVEMSPFFPLHRGTANAQIEAMGPFGRSAVHDVS